MLLKTAKPDRENGVKGKDLRGKHAKWKRKRKRKGKGTKRKGEKEEGKGEKSRQTTKLQMLTAAI